MGLEECFAVLAAYHIYEGKFEHILHLYFLRFDGYNRDRLFCKCAGRRKSDEVRIDE